MREVQRIPEKPKMMKKGVKNIFYHLLCCLEGRGGERKAEGIRKQWFRLQEETRSNPH